jgi:hypothetical protein
VKIALVGSCPSSRMLAPYSNGDWEIWACSPANAFGVLPRVTRWFEIHGDLGWPERSQWRKPGEYIDWLNSQDFMIYAQDHEHFPDANIYPLDEMIAKHSLYFFTSTFAYMMALAIAEGATEIGLFGIDMTLPEEYQEQRPAMQHFIVMCMAMGIKIGAPDESDIMRPPPLYGYVDATPHGRKMYVYWNELEGKIKENERIKRQAELDLTMLKGASEGIDYARRIWGNERVPLRPRTAIEPKPLRLVTDPAY